MTTSLTPPVYLYLCLNKVCPSVLLLLYLNGPEGLAAAFTTLQQEEMRRSHSRNESITSQTNMMSHVLQGVLSLDSQVASAARLNWTPLNFSVIGQLMFLVTVPYRKSLSWNTLRARKRADAKDGSFLGVRGQENGLLHKPKETTPLPSLASPATRAKGKVSRAHVGDVIMCEPKPPHLPPLVFIFLFNLCVRARACVWVCADLQTHRTFSG